MARRSTGNKSVEGALAVQLSNSLLHEDPSDPYTSPFQRTQLQALCSEHRLLMAVLETALHNLVFTRPHLRRCSSTYQEDYAWLWAETDAPFSYKYILQHLGMDMFIDQLRRAIQQRIDAADRRSLLIQSRHAKRPRSPHQTAFY